MHISLGLHILHTRPLFLLVLIQSPSIQVSNIQTSRRMRTYRTVLRCIRGDPERIGSRGCLLQRDHERDTSDSQVLNSTQSGQSTVWQRYCVAEVCCRRQSEEEERGRELRRSTRTLSSRESNLI